MACGLLVPAGPEVPVPDTDRTPLAIRRTWARLIRKIYEVDPLLCARCGAPMKVIAVIEDEEVIYRILAHLNLLSSEGQPTGPPPSRASPAFAHSVLTSSKSFTARYHVLRLRSSD